jgi:predicted amidohydrolase YtcJ
MKKMLFEKVSLIILLIGASFSCTKKIPPADMVVLGGKIYTASDKSAIVEAVAATGNKIVFAGAEKEARALIGSNTTVVDLEGKVMTPGFIEGHGHLMGVGYNELNLDFMNVKSFDEMIEMVRAAASQAPPGQWIIGRGWHQDKWEIKPDKMVKGFPLHQKLSEASPNNPVFLRHASGHAGFANAKAMEIAGVNLLSIEKLSSDESEGGEIIRDALGNPTGLFNERAMNLIDRRIPQDMPSEWNNKLPRCGCNA